mmetsp:Transcript_53993/g.45399  ORF Transcript_53993/g.45399 Transcript_53993/m.45399 type:complete len:90 (+) Transcript_53993:292-561(+)
MVKLASGDFFRGNLLNTRKIAFQILAGYVKLFENKIIHRDIKPENILFDIFDDESFNIKLADFGLAFNAEDSMTMSIAGTPLYSAPEML